MLQWAWQRARTRGLMGWTGTPPVAVAHGIRAARVAHGECVVTWVGHSTFLIQCDGLNILTDPVWSDRCAPVQWAGPKRIVPPGVPFSELPPIDLVLQSHDHYDHLDTWSVRAIARAHPLAHWVTSLGVGRQLQSLGVQQVTDLDWWQRADVGSAEGNAQVTCVPAQHFSGRTPFDRNRSLWSGFVLTIGARTIYFVADTGWHAGFGEIGARCGPFDLVLMPIGAYDPRWIMEPVHVNPEEAVRAFGDLARAHPASAPTMVAMHWGTFVLTDEPVDEPPARTRAAWAAVALPDDRLWVMVPGETRCTAG
ncbi:MAG: MBL fold metallo-hydrolase [Gemmatimonadetes bacterium]|nr:MBL fold metallo-hydrolase [Gemmatimonadota bacterium]